MKRWMLHAGVFALGAALAAFAWPQEKATRKHGLGAIYDELGLTAVASAELKTLDEKVGPQCKTLAETRRALYAEVRRDVVDPKEVERITAELGAIRAQMQKDVVEHLLAIKPLLTAEQRTALFDRLSRSEAK
jgi:Spy/CpxP family protein refolding chaperone